MSEVVLAALITGVLGFLGVVFTLLARRTEASKIEKFEQLRAELSGARAEAERYKAAYLGLLELTQGLLEEVS